ncbi:galactose-1-phosphate uridylyltransferase [Candidatus Gottesmanbacteria bacterium RIFCSPHIGHO2_12_FULL_40_13]|uniref:Galactose-1-phosphate uridylyltransferase n=1 Tax=Candidatus Gottesmanbacteria bacterium RIFCSPHIGHO2_01_FULL_40_15 TaxID=1798376 RepID=A0A1F5Z3H0_9BACT|nr:MAG: galactose-1-phosphate uridylyltransferase [Candidatus Gottesmanbacteria bacterium RIFCSPHIGHO2_01_FULL_40_15]OGG22962.1 MAG: galactose-1-phosphate uridylyltransferase [Candidatus Gottesmanbacteria bacterium RIFCSPHIGHO2_12_FULL_40_13]
MFLSQPHRRYNPLINEWVLVSPQRTKRPWQGKYEKIQKEKKLIYDPSCYMCPGNIRANREKNPRYKNTFVFRNDFPPIVDTGQKESIINNSGILQAAAIKGECRVVCFSPRHDLTLSEMTDDQIQDVILTWISQIEEFKHKYNWVQIFENKGELMGCSNPHPHCQIWASNFIPNEVSKEDIQQKKYFEKNDSVLLVDYVKKELDKKERVVTENYSWIVVVPFWAIWPYETLLLPKTNRSQFTLISAEEKRELAEITKNLLLSYDRLFNISMPYSMGWHFAPFNVKNNGYWQLHAHYYPPLLRSATVKKFMVGYEMLAQPQRDITPEQAASELRKYIKS